MRIKKISIDGFGLFDGRFELDLSDGVGLIVGENETGKSTLLAAVGAILFGFASEVERALFAPNNGPGPRSGCLEIDSGGKLYRFTREFSSNRTKVELLGANPRVLFDGSAKPGGRTEEKEAYDELMRGLFGLENRELFYNSVFVEQNGLPAEMGGVVRRIVSGASSADYSIVLNNLKEAYEKLTVAVPWGRAAGRKPRRIEILEAEIKEMRDTLSQNQEAAKAVENLQAWLSELEPKIKKAGESIKDEQSLEDDLIAFSRALEQKKQIEDQLGICRSEKAGIERLSEEIRRCDERISGEYSQFGFLPEQADSEIAQLARLQRNVNELEERYSRAESNIPHFKVPRLAPVAIIIGLLMAASSVVFSAVSLKALVILAGAGVLLWPFLSAAAALRSEKSAREGKLAEIRSQIDFLKAQSAEIEHRYAALGRDDLSDLLDKLREFRRLQSEKGKKEEALGQHPQIEEVDAKYNTLSNEFLVASRKLDDLRARRPRLADIEREDRTGEAVEHARAEREHFELQLREWTSERDDIKYRLAAAEARETISLEALEEKIEIQQADLDRLRASSCAYLEAVRVLDEAVDEFRSSHLSRIEQKTGDYLGRIIGSPCRVRLDEQLEPLEIGKEGRRFKPEQLSQGVRDQLHFALRLAAIEEICGENRLPILLDDPFVNFDQHRLDSTLRMLEVLSEYHQIVLLTHDRKYCDWRPPVCILKKQ